MRPVLIMGWLAAFSLSAIDVCVEAARHRPWNVLAMLAVLVLLWMLRTTIVREP